MRPRVDTDGRLMTNWGTAARASEFFAACVKKRSEERA